MHKLCPRALTLVVLLATPWVATSAHAGSPFYPSADGVQTMGRMPVMAPKRRAGVYSCGFHELHTRLERKDCR